MLSVKQRLTALENNSNHLMKQFADMSVELKGVQEALLNHTTEIYHLKTTVPWEHNNTDSDTKPDKKKKKDSE